jgi:hypothetical protein
MNRIMRVADVLEKYFPADSLLNKIPNFTYQNYYIIHDNFIGTIVSKFRENFKSSYSHIDEHTREDILAMNIHTTFYDSHNEKDIATYFHGLITEIPHYSHYQQHH